MAQTGDKLKVIVGKASAEVFIEMIRLYFE